MADHQTPPVLPRRQSSLSLSTPPPQSGSGQVDGAPPLPPRPPPTRRPTGDSPKLTKSSSYHEEPRLPPNMGVRRNTHTQAPLNFNRLDKPEGAYVTTHHPHGAQQMMPRLDAARARKEFSPIEEQEWYWGNISKEDVTEVMKDRADGSFLVRDAARSPGSYTLTLRKDGVNRLIRIMSREGYYGFAEPLEFHSVMELVDYYRSNSLHPYSPKLDITLKEPVSRFNVYSDMDSEGTFGRSGQEPVTLESVAKMYRETEEEFNEKSGYYNELSERFERTTKEIQEMRLDLAAQHQIITILKEHLTISEKAHKEDGIASDLKQNLFKNHQILKRRFSTQEHSHKNLEASLHRKETQKNQLDMERNVLKPVLKELQQKAQKQLRFLNQNGYRTSEMLAEAVEEDNPNDLYATYAMLHTYRSDAADYQRITDLIQRKNKSKPLPVPPQAVALPPQQIIDQTLGRNYKPQIPVTEYDGGHIITTDHLQNLPPNLPHFQETTWMRAHISREESRDLLQGRPDGTFLVRPKPSLPDHAPLEPVHTHTIDIVDVGKYKRIPIFCGPNGGYGFAHPYEFDSIPTLVLYYATNNMSRHNESLQNTILSYPAFLKY